MTRNRLPMAVLACFILLPFLRAPSVLAQNDRAKESVFVQTSEWACVMDDQKTELRFHDKRENLHEQVHWKILLDHRVIARGRAERVKGDSNPEIVIRFEMSNAKINAVLKLQLELKFGDQKQTNRLYLFPEDPFAQNQTTLKNAKISLYDPFGDTIEILESMKVPFERLRTLESIDALNQGLILIGEGLKLNDHKQLVETLSHAAQRGIAVVFLAPEEGSIILDLQSQRRIVLESASVIKTFDRRFDTEFWNGKPSVKTRWELRQTDGTLSLIPADSNTAWPWLELDYKNSEGINQGKMIICGCGIVSGWNNGPIARHLLWKIIKTTTERKLTKTTTETTAPDSNLENLR